MKECWSTGDLRAYIDRELPGEDLVRVAAHLEICVQCRSAHDAMAARAALVADWMGALDPAIPVRPVRRSTPPRWKWAVAVVGIAAGLAIGFLMLPKQVDAPAPVAIAPPAAQLPDAPVPGTPVIHNAAIEPPIVAQARPRSVRRARPVVPRPETVEHFVPLDAEPIETGVIMRVTWGPENLQADIIFGPDGRAHAYRLVNAVQTLR